MAVALTTRQQQYPLYDTFPMPIKSQITVHKSGLLYAFSKSCVGHLADALSHIESELRQMLPDMKKTFHNLEILSVETATKYVQSAEYIVFVREGILEKLGDEQKAIATKYNVRILSTTEEPRTLRSRYLKKFLELNTKLLDMFGLKIYTGVDQEEVNLLNPERWNKDVCVNCSMKVRKAKLLQEITEDSISEIRDIMKELHEDFHRLYYTEKKDELLLKKINSVHVATTMARMCIMNTDQLSQLFGTIMMTPFLK